MPKANGDSGKSLHSWKIGELALQGERALVTGAAGGIGRGIAEHLSGAGADVVIADLASAEAGMIATRDAIVKRGGRAMYVVMDCADPGSIEAGVHRANIDGRGIDILVNNAGIAHVGLFARQDPESIAKMVAVNLTGAMLLTRQILPGMLARDHGRLAFVASIQGVAGTPGFATYSATKGGMIRFAEALRRELVHHQIHITTVVPPAVRSEAFHEAKEEEPRMLRWELFPPVPIEQVATRTVRGIITGTPLVYAGTQSVLAAIGNRVSKSMMGFILGQAFREDAA